MHVPPTNAKLTPAGATLKLGTTAVVDFDTTLANGNDGPHYKLAVTVASIKHGSMADFKGTSLIGAPKHATPFYVKLTMTNLSHMPMKTGTDDPTDSVGAINPQGVDSSLSIGGYFPPCPQADTPNPVAPGQTFTTCETYLEKGKTTQVGYDGSSATLDTPIIWSS